MTDFKMLCTYNNLFIAIVSWNVYIPKKTGGLGVRDTMVWNTVVLGKHVWALSSKQDNLWVKWVHSIYVKAQKWRTCKPPKNCSWYWKKICNTRDVIKEVIKPNELGIGSSYSIKKCYELLCDMKVFNESLLDKQA